MYLPDAFKNNDTQALIQFIQEHPFGLLISNGEMGIEANPLPFLYATAPPVGPVNSNELPSLGHLYCHLARANDQWQRLANEVLVVFSGPHAFIAQAWYNEKNAVPTWNYQTVQVRGQASLLSDAELETLLGRMMAKHETLSPDWRETLDDRHYANLLKAIVGVRIDITAIQGKWKLSQNKNAAQLEKLTAALVQEANPEAHAIAAAMRAAARP